MPSISALTFSSDFAAATTRGGYPGLDLGRVEGDGSYMPLVSAHPFAVPARAPWTHHVVGLPALYIGLCEERLARGNS